MRFKILIIIFLFALGIFSAFDTRGCALPVFSYALKNWPQAPHQIILFHDKPLTVDEKALLKKLKQFKYLDNLDIVDCDTSQEVPPRLKKAWEIAKKNSYTTMMLYLYNEPDFPLFNGPFNSASVSTLTNLKIRKKISKLLIDGDTAVWLLLKSGDKKKDKSISKKLKKILNEAEKELKLPHELDDSDTEYDTQDGEEINLKIKFTIIEIDKNNPESKLLLSTLAILYPAIYENKETLIVPVFGQGRALIVLEDNEITKDNIFDICSFITGPCSCQIKSQNPGIDLFIPADWYSTEEYDTTNDEGIPPLSVSDSPKKLAPTPSSTLIAKKSTNSINYNYLIIAVIEIIIILSLIIFMLKKRRH